MTFNGTLFYFIIISHHFLRQTAFSLKQDTSYSKSFLYFTNRNTIIENILALNI